MTRQLIVLCLTFATVGHSQAQAPVGQPILEIDPVDVAIELPKPTNPAIYSFTEETDVQRWFSPDAPTAGARVSMRKETRQGFIVAGGNYMVEVELAVAAGRKVYRIQLANSGDLNTCFPQEWWDKFQTYETASGTRVRGHKFYWSGNGARMSNVSGDARRVNLPTIVGALNVTQPYRTLAVEMQGASHNWYEGAAMESPAKQNIGWEIVSLEGALQYKLQMGLSLQAGASASTAKTTNSYQPGTWGYVLNVVVKHLQAKGYTAGEPLPLTDRPASTRQLPPTANTARFAVYNRNQSESLTTWTSPEPVTAPPYPKATIKKALESVNEIVIRDLTNGTQFSLPLGVKKERKYFDLAAASRAFAPLAWQLRHFPGGPGGKAQQVEPERSVSLSGIIRSGMIAGEIAAVPLSATLTLNAPKSLSGQYLGTWDKRRDGTQYTDFLNTTKMDLNLILTSRLNSQNLTPEATITALVTYLRGKGYVDWSELPASIKGGKATSLSGVVMNDLVVSVVGDLAVAPPGTLVSQGVILDPLTPVIGSFSSLWVQTISDPGASLAWVNSLDSSRSNTDPKILPEDTSKLGEKLLSRQTAAFQWLQAANLLPPEITEPSQLTPELIRELITKR